MDASTVGTIVEGIGNEVLITFLIGGVSCILALAWYSTHLTSSQTRLTAPTIHRSGVRLNRLPGSSTSEHRANNTTTSREADSTTTTNNENQSSNANTATPVTPVPVTESTDTNGAPVSDPPFPEEPLTPSPTLLPSEREAEQPDISASTAEGGTHDKPEENKPAVVSEHRAEEEVHKSDEYTPPTAEETVEPVASSSSATIAPAQPAAPAQQAVPDDSFVVRLKFLTESEKQVRARSNDTISMFKQANFAEEISNNKLVRLIYNGQRLEDSRTLGSYNIAENTTIHALITDNAPQTTTQQPSTPDIAVFNAGIFMLPLFTFILAIIWYLRYEYAEFFNFTSTASLACITAVFLFCMFAQNRPQEPMNSERRYGINVRETATANSN